MPTILKSNLLWLLLFILGCTSNGYSQSSLNKYGLKVIGLYEDYHQSIISDSSNTLINISKYIPTIYTDIKYATADNFLGEAVYEAPLAFARKPVVEALSKIQSELHQYGYGLKVFDAYRPYRVTEIFYEKTQDTTFVAVPWKGSRHNRGCAVDLTLVRLKNGKELKMPTRFDDFTVKAHPDYMKLPKRVISHRELLISVMEKFGFSVYHAEWWHFDFKGWEKFDLMDIPFRDLAK